MSDEGGSDGDPDRTNTESLISYLKRGSKLQKFSVSGNKIEFHTSDGIRIFCARLSDASDPVVHKVQDLFQRSFKREERDPFRELKDVVQESEYFDVHTMQDAEGNLLCASVSGYFELPTTNEAVVFVDYIATDAAWRGRGLAKALYWVLCQSAKKRAEVKGQKIRAIFGEVKNEVEDFWNLLGWKRAYFKRGDALYEIPYFQPPLSWDFERGVAKEGYGFIPQHLMVWVANEAVNPLTAAELLLMIKTVYTQNFLPDEDRFQSKYAYRTCQTMLQNYLRRIKRKLCSASSSPLLLLTYDARQDPIMSEQIVNFKAD